MENSNEQLELNLGAIMQDLITPLTSACLNSELLLILSEDSDATEIRDCASRILRSNRRMARSIQALNDYHQIGIDINGLEYVTVGNVVTQVMNSLEPLIDEKNATIIRNELPTIVANETAFTYVLQNIIENSIQYSGDIDPTITIETSSNFTVGPQAYVEIVIRDNGSGISKNILETLFISHTNNGSRHEKNGLSLGLPISQKFIQQMGGQIHFESKQGTGTQVYLSFPEISSEKQVAS